MEAKIIGIPPEDIDDEAIQKYIGQVKDLSKDIIGIIDGYHPATIITIFFNLSSIAVCHLDLSIDEAVGSFRKVLENHLIDYAERQNDGKKM